MFIKTILFAIFTFSLLGFSVADDPTGGQLLQTEDGVILIPAAAGMTAKDARLLAGYLNEDPVSTGVIYIDGQPITTARGNTFHMNDLRALGTEFSVDIIGNGGVTGAIFVTDKTTCYRQHYGTHCNQSYRVVVEVDAARAATKRNAEIVAVLDRYGYVTIK